MTTLDPRTLLTTTRSVRRHLDLVREVPLAVLLDALAVAQQAPNGADEETWRFIVVRDPRLRFAIGEYYRRANEGFAAAVTDRAASGDPWAVRKLASAGILWRHLADVPALVVAGTEDPASFEPSAYGLASAYASVLPAVWNLQLALRLDGLGSCLVTSHLRFAGEISELLGLPPAFRHAGLLAVGYLTKDTFGPAPRRPLGDVVRVDTWSGRIPEAP